MKCNSKKNWLSVIWCIVLIAALALSITGCSSNEPAQEAPSPNNKTEIIQLGTGSKTFLFVAVDLEGAETFFEIHTDAKTVGEALQEHQLLDGEQGDYGLYVKTVNGITLDWDKDGKYWSFLIDGEYAMTGVDVTDITEGATYTFVPGE